MGSVIAKLFINPEAFLGGAWPMPKILFLLLSYGFVLMKASNLISDGSELLLLVPSVAGLVGSVVLPVLGAVPDSMIVLFSGLGPREEAQESLSVGVGALAGSTVMLLTVPWVLTLVAGRVSLGSGGQGNYRPRPKGAPKLARPLWHPWRTGVNVSGSVRASAIVMLVTTVSYLLIQGPAFAFGCSKHDSICRAGQEKWWAFAGMITCAVLFLGYLGWQLFTVKKQSNLDRIDEVRRAAISKSLISASAAFADLLFKESRESSRLIGGGSKKGAGKEFDRLLRDVFHRHDVDHNGVVDRSELKALLAELGEHPTQEELGHILSEVDTNKNGVVEYSEFEAAMLKHARREFARDVGSPEESEPVAAALSPQNQQETMARVITEKVNAGPEDEKAHGQIEEEEKEDEEEEEVPEDLKSLSPKKQKLRIIWRSCWMMALGVGIVVIFSDPMVDVLSALGQQIKVPPFYVAFILAPLASNASEVIAAFNYAKKKTVKTSTIGLESLVGAAIMNNTFCLAIFLALVWARNLSWVFSAETLAILSVELCMAVVALFRSQRLVFILVCLSLYPLSLVLVLLLEKAGLN